MPSKRRRHRPVVWVVGLSLALGVAVSAPAQAGDGTLPSRGAQLYDGRLALVGQLRGHEQALPTEALRCSNCHEPGRQALRDGGAGAPAITAAITSTTTPAVTPVVTPAALPTASSFAPRLDHSSLALPQARRGGPPTRYDQAAFCRVLRTSVDPGEVLLNKPMPRYTLSDDDCAALWQFLSQRPALAVVAP